MRNTPPEEYVLVEEANELAFIAACLHRAGAREEEAQAAARLITNCDLRSVRSHGINRAPGYCRDLKEGRLNPEPNVHVAIDTPSSVVVDGDGGLGYVPMLQATAQAITKARDSGGIGLGIARHIGHYGAAGHYTRICAEQGCVGFSVQGGSGSGGRRNAPSQKQSVAFTGAPAMSFALPGGRQCNIVLDMVAHALSEYRGEEFADLPERVPGAFFKSVGLVATAHLMGGGLTGAMLPAAREMAARWVRARHGGTVVAIHPGAIGVPVDALQREVDEYVERIKENYAPLPGFDVVLLPGEKEARSEVAYRSDGIRFGAREQEAAREMSEYLGIPLPWSE